MNVLVLQHKKCQLFCFRKKFFFVNTDVPAPRPLTSNDSLCNCTYRFNLEESGKTELPSASVIFLNAGLSEVLMRLCRRSVFSSAVTGQRPKRAAIILEQRESRFFKV